MTTLVTGAGGQLGRALLRASSDEAVALARVDLDVTDRDAVRLALAAHRPSVVVNCAAWTDVDACELDAERAWRINAAAPGFLREACEILGAHLVHISTDFVFDGLTDRPYTEADLTAPVNVYGAAKLAGEQAVGPEATVVRTSWLQDSAGRNMVGRVLDGLTGLETVPMPGDRWSTPSFSDDVAHVVLRLARERRSGVVNVVNEGVTSWADFARAVAVDSGHDPDLIWATREIEHDPPRPARRPPYSALSNTALRDLGYQPMRHHRDVAREILRHLQRI